MAYRKKVLEGETPPVSPPSDQSVSRDEFNRLLGAVTDLSKLVTALATKPEEVVKEKANCEIEVEDGSPVDKRVPPQWRKIVDDLLGKEFGAEVTYPKSGGTKFTVIVPRDKSNAPAFYWESHINPEFRLDRRTAQVGNRGIEGVSEWCNKIKLNLTSKQPKIL